MQFEMANNFSTAIMSAFFNRGAHEIQERLTFGRKYGAYQGALPYTGRVETARQQIMKDKRFLDNCEALVSLKRNCSLGANNNINCSFLLGY